MEFLRPICLLRHHNLTRLQVKTPMKKAVGRGATAMATRNALKIIADQQ